ncbi:MAG: SDR family oxidoreductase [Mobilicoccus sp.]|nr:SDR family oxidoreductase [Mobilicoccus sp.]
MTTALITGATSGIGAAFADRLAADGHDLVLVARSESTLQEKAATLRAGGVEVEVLVADLADREAVEQVAERLRSEGSPVDLLINNAGFGTGQGFLENDIAEEERSMAVMMQAVMVLSHAAGRAMAERGHGAIINVSSVASFMYSGSYSAAKAWVTTFTEGIATELEPRGVVATALCPGLTRTDFHRRAGITGIDQAALWLQVDDVVDTCLADVRRRKVISVPGVQYKVLTSALEVMPRPLARAISRALR